MSMLMVLTSILKLLNGPTPMLVTFVDLPGLIISIPLISLLITLPNSSPWIGGPPSIKVLMMKLGVCLT